VQRLLRSGSTLGLICALTLGGCGSTTVPLTDQRSSPSGLAASESMAPSITTAPSASPPATAQPVPSFDRVAGWRADIDALLAARESIHPDPWHGMRREDWIAAADGVKARMTALTDDQALAELVMLAAMPSWAGRDGHTGIFLTPGSGIHAYPVRWWRFSDGLVITTAWAPYQDLVGSRVVAIGGHPIDDVLALVEPLAPRDNPSNLLAYGPLYLRVSELLAGLGVIDHAGPATFSLVGRDGETRDVSIEPISVEDDVNWNSQQPHRLPPTDATWLRDQAKPLWWTYLADSRTLFVQYNAVEAGIDPIADEILARAKEDDVARIVVDLRHNGGGDNTTMGHLEDVLRDPAINRPGRLVVLIGRITLSAAANFATDLEQSSAATFAGEAMGGSPNLYGDAREVALPYGGQSVYIASRYWQRSTPDDPRITIEPEIQATLSSTDYFAGRDPVLQAVFDTPVGPG
jgi:hypothetical protein